MGKIISGATLIFSFLTYASAGAMCDLKDDRAEIVVPNPAPVKSDSAMDQSLGNGLGMQAIRNVPESAVSKVSDGFFLDGFTTVNIALDEHIWDASHSEWKGFTVMGSNPVAKPPELPWKLFWDIVTEYNVSEQAIPTIISQLLQERRENLWEITKQEAGYSIKIYKHLWKDSF